MQVEKLARTGEETGAVKVEAGRRMRAIQGSGFFIHPEKSKTKHKYMVESSKMQ